jgi:hypothetical protein
MRVPPPTPYREGLSKNLFECPLCTRLVRASQLINDINGLQVRDARLFCASCDKTFERMPRVARAEFLRRRFEEHYGDKQFIYALNDPQTGARRYVGRARDPRRRYQQHIQQARQLGPPQSDWPFDHPAQDASPYWVERWEKILSSKRWIATLLEAGVKPELEVLESVDPPVRVSEREMRWISQSIKEGDDLLNAENSSAALRRLIRRQQVESFLTVDLDKLIRSKFPPKLEHLLGGRDTGWRRAVLIHTLYKPRPILTTSYLTPRMFHLGRRLRKSLERLITA